MVYNPDKMYVCFFVVVFTQVRAATSVGYGEYSEEVSTTVKYPNALASSSGMHD